MAKEKSLIIRELHDKIMESRSFYQEWYVGISKDPNKRLYDHNVEPINPYQYEAKALSSEEARDIEYYFVRLLKTDGLPGGGDGSASWVYAYKKGPNTKP